MRRAPAQIAGGGAVGASLLLGLLLAGCSDDEPSDGPANVSAEVSDSISTVVHVSWTTDTPSIGYVEYGVTEQLGLTTPLEPEHTTDHRLTLLGLTQDTVYYYRVVTWEGGAAGASAVMSISTGDLPRGMPRLTLTGDGHDLFTVAPILGQNTAITILDPRGEIVWYHTDDRELDFYRARISRDGKSLLYNAASVSGDPSENSELVRVALDGSETSSIAVPLLAHDFVEHEDGTLAAIAVEYRDFEGLDVPLQGNEIVEITPDGDQTTVWSAWDCFDPEEVKGDDFARGWTFANALDYDASEDAYYLGMRNLSSIAKIDRASGACEWVFGLNASTFEFAPGSARFLHQHQFQVRGNRILVMDNDGSLENESRVVEYELDFANQVATEVWRYTSDPTVYTFVLGEPTRLDDGGVFINWSAAGQMERLDGAGASIWKLNTEAGYVFGFNTLVESLYPPSARRP